MELHDNKIENSDRELKKSNLCIDRVVEIDSLSLLKVVNDLFCDLEKKLKAEDVCQSIYQKGLCQDQDGSKPRPIIVCFRDTNVKGQIFKSMKKLAGNPLWVNVYANEDYTPDQIGKLKELHALMGTQNLWEWSRKWEVRH